MGWEEGKRRLERKKRKVYRAREGMFKHTHSHTLAPYTCVYMHSIVAMSHNFFPPSLPLPIILLIALTTPEPLVLGWHEAKTELPPHFTPWKTRKNKTEGWQRKGTSKDQYKRHGHKTGKPWGKKSSHPRNWFYKKISRIQILSVKLKEAQREEFKHLTGELEDWPLQLTSPRNIKNYKRLLGITARWQIG